MGYKNVIVTKHIKERICERFPSVYENIKDNPDGRIKTLINEGDVSRSFINDSKFMNYLYETYGYGHTYDFVVNGDIVFVIKKNEGQKIAVTCLNKKTTTFIKKAIKFKKKDKVGVPYDFEEAPMDIEELLKEIKR